MNLAEISIIIVNWNGGEVFKKCLVSLKKIKSVQYELIIVDNGSTDGTQNFATIKNTSNLGFAIANNQGFAVSKGKYILLLNNDTLVTSNFLYKLTQRLESDPGIGVIQPKIHVMDNPKLLDTVGSFLTATGFLQHWGYLQPDGPEFDKSTEIFSAKGACMLIRREVIKKVGLFDPAFGSYFEETDFCWRVWLAGWKVIYYPKSNIYHKIGFSSKRMDPVEINYNSFKNRLTALIKNLSLSSSYILFNHVLILIFLGSYYLIRLQSAKSSMVWRAIFWNLTHLSQTLTKRKQVQSQRTISDQKLFKHILHCLDFKTMLTHFSRSEKDFSSQSKVLMH